MVFRRNTLKNTKTFKQINKTSSGTSNINTLSTKQNIPTPQTSKHVSGSGSRSEEPKRQTYNTKSTNEWSLKSMFPSIEVSGFLSDASAEHIDTQGNLDAENEKLIPGFRLDDNAQSEGEYEDLYNSPGGHRINTNRYNPKPAEAGPSSQEILDSHSDSFIFTPTVDKKIGTMEQGLFGRGFYENKDGTISKATPKPGSTPSIIKDYINNKQSNSYYNLPSHVSQSAHNDALDKQSLAKFENSIQKSFTTMIRESGPDERFGQGNFDKLKSQINYSNIPQSKKDDLISEYTNKITNYQKAAGGYGTDTPWSFGTSQPKNPNKAEKLKKKIDSGNFSEREYAQYQTLTGNTQLYSGGIVTRADGSIKDKILTYKDLF